MAPRSEKSQLKRPRGSLPEDGTESKKPRRSDRLSQADCKTPVVGKQHLPSPVTGSANLSSTDRYKEPTETPPRAAADDDTRSRRTEEPCQALSSPPQDTQPLSQYNDRHAALPDEVEDEVKEGVWGYLLPLDAKYGDKAVVLKQRNACPLADALAAAAAETQAKGKDGKPAAIREAEAYNSTKIKGIASGGYLIGRHPECDIVVAEGVVSNRHCLLFNENQSNDSVALVEDLSSNGTYVNEAIVGRNQRRELEDGDEIAVHGKARFIFRYPRSRRTSAFLQQYTLKEKLGKGHFAEVYLCVEKASGRPYAVKVFSKPGGVEDRSKTEGLQQEIGVLMSVSHPNVLCLKDTFNDRDRVYLVLELAPEGELFNHIVMKQKLTEDEARRLFRQLFQGIKYLHERNIVHRDIKPENILMVDKNLRVKIADFGLAKIIGEESFTTTLCGTPSYVAPEILADSKQRKYTKAVDIWSLGVVLYICLCGFPPFSDELYSRDFPFTLSQQIRSGRFDYPSPYWDSVGDPALDLIDSMLMVDPANRFTIDQCLGHPWLTQNTPGANDSTGGLVGGIAGLEVERRAPHRERTLLASLNSVEVTAQLPTGEDRSPVKVFSKNKHHITNAPKEMAPDGQRAAKEFMGLGGKGDQQLFPDDSSSIYAAGESAAKTKKKGKAR
ncbi:CAMK/RAD53 protein kinase [Ophiocordyceps camponoti-floridani]|uniref:CAMK/RAD53 protein kinase n=1 Tax=Ophiocordyceps camponoti-floridani TaxID=2030778 RepID=A0A8H4Q0V4_9HYPO|nr:CAMK/RAD53 protein kinase [Ophiocordyceps camponoti-floridani]